MKRLQVSGKNDKIPILERKQNTISLYNYLRGYKDICKLMQDDIRWNSDVNFKAFLTKEYLKTITLLWLRVQTVILVWTPLDFSKLCWISYVCSAVFSPSYFFYCIEVLIPNCRKFYIYIYMFHETLGIFLFQSNAYFAYLGN